MATDNKDDTKAAESKASDIIKATEEAVSNNSEPTTSEDKSKTESNVPPVLSDTVSTSSTGNKSDDNSKSIPKAGEKPVPPPKQKPQGKSGAGIGWLALLIALTALAGVAYGWWLLQQDKQAEGAQQARLNQSQSQLMENVSASTQALSQQVKSFASKSEGQQTLIAELQTQLQATSRQIGEVTQVSRRSWMLAEAEYLLRLANQRLLMERETGSALSLLTSADQILLTVAEPGLFEVREQLAREIADLRAVAHLDVEGIFVQLSALGEQVQALALLTPEGEASEATEEAMGDANKAAEDSGGVFASALENFSDMVIVRHRDEPLEPLLTPEQHFYVQQNLRLMLEQAQLALLQRNPGVYSNSLIKAEGWVQEYFQLNANSTALLTTLQELQKIDVNPELPDISASLGLLKAYLTLPAPGEKAEQTSQPVAEAGAAQ